MAFFDKVKQVASDVVAVSGKQGKKYYSIAKLNLEIAEKQNSVKNLYKEIGFEAYKAYKQNADVLEAIKEKLGLIDVQEEKIAVLRKAIDDVKNVEEVGVEEDYVPDAEAEEADVYDGQSQYVESETEPIDDAE